MERVVLDGERETDEVMVNEKEEDCRKSRDRERHKHRGYCATRVGAVRTTAAATLKRLRRARTRDFDLYAEDRITDTAMARKRRVVHYNNTLKEALFVL